MFMLFNYTAQYLDIYLPLRVMGKKKKSTLRRVFGANKGQFNDCSGIYCKLPPGFCPKIHILLGHSIYKTWNAPWVSSPTKCQSSLKLHDCDCAWFPCLGKRWQKNTAVIFVFSSCIWARYVCLSVPLSQNTKSTCNRADTIFFSRNRVRDLQDVWPCVAGSSTGILCYLHGDTFYLYLWLVGLEGIFWSTFISRFSSPLFTWVHFSISIKLTLTKIPDRRARTTVQTGTRYINHLNETSAKSGWWKEDVSWGQGI